jgi:signal transduction histidine kinase
MGRALGVVSHTATIRASLLVERFPALPGLPVEVQMGRGVGLGLGVAAAVLGGFAVGVPLSEGAEAVHFVEGGLALAVGLSFVASGLVAWSRRPANRTGPLMVLVGYLWFLGLFEFAQQPALHDLGAWVRPLHIAVFAHLLLAFPSGRLDSPVARALVVIGYADLVVLENIPLVLPEGGTADSITKAALALMVAVFAAGLVLLAVRWREASPVWRRSVAPLLLPGAIGYASLILFLLNSLLEQPLGSLPGWFFRIGYAAIPVVFLVGLLQGRLARASVAELVVELGESRPPGELRDALARALGDPSLRLLYWLPEEQRYVDLDGRTVELSEIGSELAATVVERDGRRVGAILHDVALLDDPELIRAVSAAAALALENERLQATLRARLEELRASRARIVEAADLERKRIERNLHDATQQRLTSIAMALGLASSKLGKEPDEARGVLDEARKGLSVALAELRDLSQGIHPGLLTERGLRPALEDLAYSAQFPIRVTTELNGRLPEQVEAGAYYVIAEALANVAKHASASSATVRVWREDGRLLLSIRDDGIGGADPRGSGLRGLADRVQALGGTLAVDSPAQRGTEIRAEIPCA